MSEQPAKSSFHGEFTDIGKDLNFYIPSDKKTTDVMKSSSLFMENTIKTLEVALHDIKQKLEPYWLNSEPLVAGFVDDVGESFLFFLSEQIKNQVILFDFWDFTIPQSLRCLQFNRDLLRKYGSNNFLIIGIHCSQFPFASTPENVRQAAHRLGVTYPIAIDHDFAVWRAFENRFWPRRILMDQTQKIIADQVGDSGFPEIEKKIQIALREISPGLPCPRIVAETEAEIAFVERTSNSFFGLEKGTIGNQDKKPEEGSEVVYNLLPQTPLSPGKPYLHGPWITTAHSVYLGSTAYNKGVFTDASSIKIRFLGSSAYLVTGARFYNQSEILSQLSVEILIDGRTIRGENRGVDIKLDASKRTMLPIVEPRLYEIYRKGPLQEHELEIKINPSSAENFEIYAFYFSKR